MLDGPAGCMARPLPSSSSRPGTDAAPAAPHGGQRAAHPPGNVREIIMQRFICWRQSWGVKRDLSG